MFQIGELAKRCGVTTDTLRFYEKMCQIQPKIRQELFRTVQIDTF